MLRKYDYRRKLPHLQKDYKALFITFGTKNRWILPEAARVIVLATCLYGKGVRFRLYGVVVMPDHAHLVLMPLADGNGNFSTSDHKFLHRKGLVWQQESFDHVLRQEKGIRAKGEYLINNPVRAGLVRSAEEYPWVWYERPLGG